MVSTSKILTVSYGTFSCTLEGFDDSFDTMKAIAEYFRDLSAGDRYFGAEPATPDAEMLARIAEREISRRVEAGINDGTIHLRAGPAAIAGMTPQTEHTAAQAQPASDPVAPAAEPAAAKPRHVDTAQSQAPAATQPAAPAAPAPVEAEPFANYAAPRPAPSARAVQSSSESIADKLRRIRAVAGPSGPAFNGADFDEEDQIEGFLSEPAIDPAAELPVDAGFETHEDAIDREDNAQVDQQDDESVTSNLGSEVRHSSTEEHETNAAPTEDSDLTAVSDDEDEQIESIFAADDTQSADSDAIAASAPDGGGADGQSDDDILSRLGNDDLIAATADLPDEGDAGSSDDLGEVLTDSPDDEDALAEVDGSQDDRPDTLALLLADTLQGGATSQAETDATAQVAAHDTDADQAAAQTVRPEAAWGTADDAIEEPETSQDQPLDSRVVKMKRADLDAALGGQKVEDEADDIEGDDTLSPDAEADLQRELAGVEAELSHSPAPDALVLYPADAPAPETADANADADAGTVQTENAATPSDEDDDGLLDEFPRHMFEPLRDAADTYDNQDTPDAQANRIFDEADSQLGEPESNKRRSAIQHLRAAVAATRAERRAGGAMTPSVDDQPYRKDLQSAVRPRRPQAVTSATPRPGAVPSGRPAPLKLVAEQRIDMPAAPVRPRRITRADLIAGPARNAASAGWTAGHRDADMDFAEYAERVGANSLTDLLEAAAAYMADIEGTPQFSRPMLMQKLREAHEDDFSREEGLRSFGQLLRQGKLQKLKGGRFAITDVTDFRQSA